MISKVSVILPTYNHEKYIAPSIESVLGQDLADFELIVVDDGSEDGTVKVAESFADPRVRIIKFAANKGLSVALNQGIAAAVGKYIAILHSDDTFLPDKLGRQVRYLEEHLGVGAVFSHVRLIDETGNEFAKKDHYYYGLFDQPNRTRHQWLNHFFRHGNCLCHPSLMIRKTVFDTVGGYDERLALLEDMEYWIRLCLVSDIHVLPEKLVRYRIRDYDLNASGPRPETRIRCSFEMIRVLQHYLRLKSAAEFAAIFPEAGVLAKGKDMAVPYCIATLALGVDSPEYRYFAVDTLYKLLADPAVAEFLQAEYGFTHVDLIKLTGQHDVFNLVQPSLSKIYLDTGKGFSEAESLSCAASIPRFDVELPFPAATRLRAVRWDPAEGIFCRVKIDRASYLDGRGREKRLNDRGIQANGVREQDGSYLFATFDPRIEFKIDDKISRFTVRGFWEPLSFAEAEQILQKKNDLLRSLDQPAGHGRSILPVGSGLTGKRIAMLATGYNAMAGSKKLIAEFIRRLQNRECVLAVSHSDYQRVLGGTEKVLRAEQALLAGKKVSYVQIYPAETFTALPAGDTNQIIGVNVDGQTVGLLSTGQLGLLLGLLQGRGCLKVRACHIHHLKGFSPPAVDSLLRQLGGTPVRIFLHDYYTLCPQYNLLANDSTYCGAPPVGSPHCQSCTHGRVRTIHSEAIGKILKNTGEFIAPSPTAAQIWGGAYPALAPRIKVIPHQICASRPARENEPGKRRIRVAYVGYQAANKGWEVWRDLAGRLDRRYYELFHFGKTSDKLPGVKHIPVPFLDEGKNAMAAKLREWGIDIAFLWSVWPETYSFTFFESIAAGCYVVTGSVSGNIAAQTEQTGRGRVFAGEEAMFGFFRDLEGVRQVLRETRATQPPVDLVFNPALGELVPPSPAAKTRPVTRRKDDSKVLRLFDQQTTLVRKVLALDAALRDARSPTNGRQGTEETSGPASGPWRSLAATGTEAARGFIRKYPFWHRHLRKLISLYKHN